MVKVMRKGRWGQLMAMGWRTGRLIPKQQLMATDWPIQTLKG